MRIHIEIRTVYGIDTVYPVCETARKLARLAGTKSLTREALLVISDLGYDIEVIDSKAAKLFKSLAI